jgi:hypothetical protein
VPLHVFDRTPNQIGIIMECPHRGIAEKADDSADLTGPVVVVDLFGLPLATDGAQSALLPNELVHLVGAYAITVLQMIVTLTTTVIARE